jgi:hypothetical protein
MAAIGFMGIGETDLKKTEAEISCQTSFKLFRNIRK